MTQLPTYTFFKHHGHYSGSLEFASRYVLPYLMAPETRYTSYQKYIEDTRPLHFQLLRAITCMHNNAIFQENL